MTKIQKKFRISIILFSMNSSFMTNQNAQNNKILDILITNVYTHLST